MYEPQTPIETAIARAGGAAVLGRRLGVSGKAVLKWRRSRVPAERVLGVEAVTGVTRHDLRPDLYPRGKCACPDCTVRHR